MSDGGSSTARALGYAGLLPFVAAGGATIAGLDPAGFSARALLVGYAVTILSFLGAVHWGMAVANPGPTSARDFSASVVPPLIAWVALALAAPWDLALLAAAFPAWYLWERRTLMPAYPAWFRGLRLHLTSVVTLTLATVILLTR